MVSASRTTPETLICARCERTFTAARPSGLFRAWLHGYCDDCKKAVEEEERVREEKRVAELRAREESERRRRREEKEILACGGVDPWQRYKFETYRPELHPNFKGWFSYMKNFQPIAKNLFVYGPTGVGKTHLTIAKGRTIMEAGGTFRWFHVDEFIGEVFGSGRISKAERNERIKEFAKIDCAILDEFHTIENQRHIDAVQLFFDLRQRMGKFGLIVIANVSLKGIADITKMPLADRMDDRTFEIYCVPENTPSARGIVKRQMGGLQK